MIIKGLNKLTLLDYPEKTACIIFTAGCNFKCPFCHNSYLVIDTDTSESISEAQIFDFLSKRKNMLDGVCISGGEPTLQNDLYNFILKIKKMGYSIKLDTNGTNPKIIEQLISDKLIDYIAMDIKNSYAMYPITCGLSNSEKIIDLTKIDKSKNIILNSNIDYEFRTTIIDEYHTEQSILDMGKSIQGAKILYLQAFKSSESTILQGLHKVSIEKAQYFASILKHYINNVKLRGY